ncbi:MAG: hypothetical protein WCF85_15670 [Rhodospirillaceae bacterium]
MNVKLIQTILVVVGVLIVAGFLFLAFVAYERATGTGYFGKATAAANAEPVFPVGTAGAPALVALGLSADARIETIHDFGARILLHVRQPGLGDRLYLIDPKTGAVLSAIATGSVVPALPVSSPSAH